MLSRARLRYTMWLSGLVLVLFMVGMAAEAQTNLRCALRNGLNKKQCDLLGRYGCPVRFLSKGCKSPAGTLLKDGGCQPTNTCSYCCKQSCTAAKKKDRSCTWSVSAGTCFKCWNGGVADNGAPAIPGATAVLPADWEVYGLGDSFTIYPNCNSRGEFITGMNLWLAETDPLKTNEPLTDIDVRIVLFHRDTGFYVGEWSGLCTQSPFKPRKPLKNASLFQIRRVGCDFTNTNKGIILHPGPCTLPALPHGSYELLFQHSGSRTLGWVQSLQNTGCNNAECSFSQQMASTVETRLNICEFAGVQLQNFAFQVLGTTKRPSLAGCP